MKTEADAWNSSDPYEYFMGRWSKLMAPVFLKWLNLPGNLSWLDIGCGTGALSEAIMNTYEPGQLSGMDSSSGFLEKAKQRLPGTTAFIIGSASEIPEEKEKFHVVVSGLALNFFPDINAALLEMQRVLKANCTIAAYVWDYAGKMDMLRFFWDAATEVDVDANRQDEGVRFPICDRVKLKDAFEQAGFAGIEMTSLDVNTVFKNFDDYWQPFLGGQGPAGSYIVSLNKKKRGEIKNKLLKRLPMEPDGSIRLVARAIAVRGTK